MLKTDYGKIESYTAKDGSLVRELMHPKVHGNSRQSLAEAVIPVGPETHPHRHLFSGEIYHITEETGLLTMGKEQSGIKAGDTVRIRAATPHGVRNTGSVPLRILCCCSPAYSHEDSELILQGYHAVYVKEVFE